VGEKPFRRAKVELVNGEWTWNSLAITEEHEINLIATAVRQAFRHSDVYKKAIKDARVETEKGPRYRCAMCGKLAMAKQIQVDHIEPIAGMGDFKLDKSNVIDRIWTDRIQVLDKKCHAKKSAQENKLRTQNKRLQKKLNKK
jgi:5-methylcytosine-specific restriction endonuclease McrA